MISSLVQFLSSAGLFVAPAIILDILAKATMLLALALLLCAAMRRASAASKHYLLGLTLVGLCLIPVLSAFGPQLRILPSSWTLALREQSSPPAATSLGADATATAAMTLPPIDRTAAPVGLSHYDSATASDLPPVMADPGAFAPEALPHPLPIADPQPSEDTTRTWLPIVWQVIAALWLLGCLVALTRLALAMLRLRVATGRVTAIDSTSWRALAEQLGRRLGMWRRVRLVKSDRAAMPMTWGVWQPQILLPADCDSWSEERKRVVLLHELAHIQRYDSAWLLLTEVVRAVYWFHPLVWVLARQMTALRERACDDRVLAAGHTAVDYAEHLLHIAAHNARVMPPCTAAIGMARANQLESRIRLILDAARNRADLSRKLAGGLALLLAMIVIPLAMLRAADRQPRDAMSLHYAAIHSPDRIADLIARGERVDEPDDNGFTPLWQAVRFSKRESVRQLLRASADPSIADDQQGWTPLHCNAFCNSEPDCVAIAQLLLEHGARVDAREPSNGETSLHFAVRAAKSLDLTKLLLESDAEVNARTSAGDTPLQFAVSGGEAKLADLLLDHGADPELRNDTGFRPIDQINAIAPAKAAAIQVVFRTHGADDQRRPELARQHRAGDGNRSEPQPDARATISGKIILADGSPANVEGQMYYNIRYADGNSAAGTDERYTEKFSLSMNPGTLWLTYYAQGFAPAWTEKIELRPGEVRDDIELVLTQGISQGVRVVDEEGRAVTGATLVAHPEIHGTCQGPIFKHTTSEQGNVTLQHLASTRYQLKISAPGFQPLRTAPLSIDEGETLRPMLIRSNPAAGIVRFADGSPAPNTKLRAIREWPLDGDGSGFGSEGDGFWGTVLATTDSRGRFRLDQLTDGSHYLFVIEAADGARAIVDNVQAGQEDLQIVLPERKDLIVNVLGDLSKLPQRKGQAFVSVRQPVKVVRPDGSFGELIGADAMIEPTETGGRAVFRGLAIDLRESAPKQTVRVKLGYDNETQQTVDINQQGPTVVEFDRQDGREPTPAVPLLLGDRFVVCPVTTDLQRQLLSHSGNPPSRASVCLLVNTSAFPALDDIDDKTEGLDELRDRLTKLAEQTSNPVASVRLIDAMDDNFTFQQREQRMEELDKLLTNACKQAGIQHVRVTRTFGVHGPAGQRFQWRDYIGRAQQATRDRNPNRERTVDIGAVRVSPVHTFLSRQLSNADCIVDVVPIVRDVDGARFVEDVLPTVKTAVNNIHRTGGDKLLIRLRYAEAAKQQIEAWVQSNNPQQEQFVQDVGFKRVSVSQTAIAQSEEQIAAPPADRPQVYTYPLTVSGRALNQQGEPISGARIFLAAYSPGHKRLAETTTNQQGDYRFEDEALPIQRSDTNRGRDSGGFEVFGIAGGYALSWRPTKYLDPTRTVVGDRSPSNPLSDWKTTYGREETVSLDLTFSEPTSFRGRLVDDLGQPLPNAKVAIRGCKTERKQWYSDGTGYDLMLESGLNSLNERAIVPPEVKSRITDDDGWFEFTGLPANNRWRLNVRPVGHSPRFIYAVSANSQFEALDVSDSYRGDFEVVFPRPRQATFRVVYGDTGQPAEGVGVGATVTQAGFWKTTDENGLVTAPLGDGTYDLGLSPRIGTPYLKAQHQVVVSEESVREPIEIKLNPAALVEIVVRDADTNQPLANVDAWWEEVLPNGQTNREVRWWRSWEAETGISHAEKPRTDASGKMRVLFPPGKHRIGVAKVAFPAGFEPVDVDGREIEMKSGEPIEVEFQLRRTDEP